MSSGSAGVLEVASDVEVVFNRNDSIADVIEALIGAATTSIDAALYGFSSQRLASALEEAQSRRLRLRLIIDGNKYRENPGCQRLLADRNLSFRLAFGRDGAGSKMHHKFALLDRKLVLSGSYNWTAASEGRNYENLRSFETPTWSRRTARSLRRFGKNRQRFPMRNPKEGPCRT